MKLLFASSVSCTLLMDENGDYYAHSAYTLFLNGEKACEGDLSVCSLYGLLPDTEYALECRSDGRDPLSMTFRTQKEYCALDVRRFGAKGDGVTDDTQALQAAILCCPDGGRVTLPRGVYKSGPLFLKSHITVEFKQGAVLSLLTDKARFPVLPGVTRTSDEKDEYLLGSWEGNPLNCYAAAITGINVCDVKIIGEGIVDGCAQQAGWWIEPKKYKHIYRGRLFYLKDCADITVQGIHFRNSPAWNLHPTFSHGLTFLNVFVEAPSDSPNTDGFDPESCRDIRMYGTAFSVGDDCIAIKSGKIYMGAKYHTPSENIEIAWCHMQRGHGGVTIGSEMAGGVKNVTVHHCRMTDNDRGLRIKTRRGRGENGVIDNIVFSDVVMERVLLPLAVNSMYFCDPDGHSEFVQSREPQPVNETTPRVGSILYERVRAEGCSSCTAYILGLPERPVESIALRDCEFSFVQGTKPMTPIMAEGITPVSQAGVIAHYVKSLTLKNVIMRNIRGERLQKVAVENAEDR